MRDDVVVIGGGLAGSEAAWQAAERGARVTLYEMRPKQGTAAHHLVRQPENEGAFKALPATYSSLWFSRDNP